MGPGARELWSLYEPIHAVVYFTEECRAAADDAGYKGFWMGYFAMRAAPLGPVGSAVVTAAFYGFHPSRAARALPAAWNIAGPAEALAARLAGVDAALRRVWGTDLESDEVRQAADLAWEAAQGCDTAGRVLGAGNQALARPDRPHLALWQACTTLREHRGDGHNAALIAAGIGPVHAHLLKIAAGETTPSSLRQGRNWPDDDWTEAADEMVDRGWVTVSGGLTGKGMATHHDVEQATDNASERPWRALGEARTKRLVDLLTPLAHDVIATGAFPLPNPIGARPVT